MTVAEGRRERIRRTSSGGPREDVLGWSRAVLLPDGLAPVSGRTSVVDGEPAREGDPDEQTRTAFRAALDPLAERGLGAEGGVRTRRYLSQARDREAAGRAHHEPSDAVRPAASMIIVSGFTDPRLVVEVEAYRGAAR
ncbi:Rid family hydrolase [Streptomyces sp. BBFR102]|uniref:Rid family hydrolase n=1 Tax=Streptomyces sp. BBFR102 TaxID=3448171 RepID=UPI003F534BE7